jgi:hypothetical protein
MMAFQIAKKNNLKNIYVLIFSRRLNAMKFSRASSGEKILEFSIIIKLLEHPQHMSSKGHYEEKRFWI